MTLKNALATLVLLAPSLSAFGAEDLAIAVQNARERKQKTILSIADPLEIYAFKKPEKANTPSSRTTVDVTVKWNGSQGVNSPDSETEILCTLQIWQGLIASLPAAKDSMVSFPLKGTWHITRVTRKKDVPMGSFERTEYEVSLWPSSRDSSLVELSIYSINLAVKTPKDRKPEVTTESLKHCFGPTTTVFQFTPSR